MARPRPAEGAKAAQFLLAHWVRADDLGFVVAEAEDEEVRAGLGDRGELAT